MFAFISPPAEQKWAPHFYCPPTPTSSLGKTITRLIRVWSHSLLSLKRREQPEAIRVSRKEETNNAMSDGSVLFPEEGELPYANPQNWLRPPPLSRHGEA